VSGKDTPRPCKIGTVPSLVILRGSEKPKLGEKIMYRIAEDGSKWECGIVDRINPDGYFFMSKL